MSLSLLCDCSVFGSCFLCISSFAIMLTRNRGLVTLHGGSYMSAHVLLSLLNDVRKRDKMRGLPSILSLYCNEFNKFNNARDRMLDSIYHMALRLL